MSEEETVTNTEEKELPQNEVEAKSEEVVEKKAETAEDLLKSDLEGVKIRKANNPYPHRHIGYRSQLGEPFALPHIANEGHHLYLADSLFSVSGFP